MFDKLKRKVQKLKISDDKKESLPDVGSSEDLSKREIYRNRYNFGVNFGSLFVQESYIYHSLFSEGGDNEHDAIAALVAKSSVEEVARKLQQHYESYVSDQDWQWLQKEAGVTAVRLPIGYWHVDNGRFISKDMKFHDLKSVYEAAKPWEAVRKIIKSAADHGIGILVDIHGVPGGANKDAHSGENSGQANFFSTQAFVAPVVDDMVPFIVKDICKPNENVIGLQVINEAAFSNSAKDEKKFYAKVIQAVQSIDDSLPVVISDGWWPAQWADWLEENKFTNSVVIDSHVYRCFSDSDKKKNAAQITDELPQSVNFSNDKADYMVGEFSCVLDGNTWEKTKENRDECVSKFGQKQTQVFQDKASWGWFFWTFKFQEGDGGEWGFQPMVNKGCIPKRPRVSPAIDDKKVQQIVDGHVNYWNGKGKKFEHERFEDGLQTAISDIQAFDEFDHSRVGRTHFFKSLRRSQHVAEKGDSEFVWEWEQGYDQGLSEFNKYL
ncbi:LANO_0A03224g1_1 [Lachancea nothofagi CBS 11611]|uniref:LANO_0A03224g1_1 n=1 Tax=Lachancea nothofagi CBS 11611 TaxID=1266666 RepID=A0A1G4IPV1_9SACH|nr:LANO_0A03224g1_1 [Lachancea nothofagi CBS 11611]